MKLKKILNDSMKEKKEIRNEIEDVKKKIRPILENYGVKKAGLFGSVVRGELTEDSDIDILVEIEKDISLLEFVGFKLEIEKKLGRKVDLVEYSEIKPLLKDIILREQVAIL